MPAAVSRLPRAVPPPSLLVPRRAVLGGVAALALPWLAGCAAEAAPRSDVTALSDAIAAEQDLVASYEAARTADPSLASRLDPVLAHHREHLRVLRRHLVPGSGHRRHEGGAIPAPRAMPLPGGGAQVLAALRGAEESAAAARVTDAGRMRPGLAQLVASIGACEAGHAGTLRPPVTRAAAPSRVPALQTALAAEHAAVYGYGLLGRIGTGGQGVVYLGRPLEPGVLPPLVAVKLL
ncbi:hypothetical protein, partial [Actinomadura roseirufa]|uniref:hypothetical protein n=1 Tax=Actinomadura roseirufa TaxID=2094049 RepID=UPI001A955133